MVMQRILEKTWNQDILFSALVELTYRCNLDCFFCYNDVGLKGRPLDDAQYFALFEDLAAMQVMNLTFTGGEPTVHPSFLTLGRRARELGFVVRIKSNGHALAGRLLRTIRETIDPFVVELSLHGAEASSHDRQTRVPGSFERLLETLRDARTLGQRVKLNATLTRWNEHQIEEMFALADGLGVRLSITPTVTPRDDGDTSPLAVAPSAEGVRRLYRYLDERIPDAEAVDTCTGSSPSLHKNCGAGASGVAVDPFGTVYPCVQWRRPLGSLHERSLREIWGDSPALREIRRLNRRAKEQRMALGDSGDGLAHCMGLSEEKTGDPLAVDPDAAANARALRQARAENRAARVDAPSTAAPRVLLPVVR
ncbi:MAG: radical SAM protein [Acidobacteriota bacterium]